MRTRFLLLLIGFFLFVALSLAATGTLVSPGLRQSGGAPDTDRAQLLGETALPVVVQISPTAPATASRVEATPTVALPLPAATVEQPTETAVPLPQATVTARPPSPTLGLPTLPPSPLPTATGLPVPAAPVPARSKTTPPTARAASERLGGPVAAPNKHGGPRWVTLQAGHWHANDLPDELQHLSGHTGASAAGANEVDINVAVAQLTAKRLQERGYNVEVLDANVPVSYTTDLFLALHADGNASARWRGFKAVAPWVSVPASDSFAGILYEEYGKATGLPSDALTSEAMADYYAFNPVRYRHAITPGVPAALLEMGFVTNPEDRKALTTRQDDLAWGIANAVDRYFRSGAAGNTPTPYPSFTPTATPTSTPTSIATSTPTATTTPTETATPVPTEQAVEATQTAAQATPLKPMPTLPRPTSLPSPTATTQTGIITSDGRWLPPLSQNGHNLPLPGSKASPVLLTTSTQDRPLAPDGRETEQVWQQFYVPELGRSVWKKGELTYVRR